MTSSDGIIRAVGREFSPSRHHDLSTLVSHSRPCVTEQKDEDDGVKSPF